MSAILGLIVLLLFIFVWCRPVLKRQKEVGGYIDKKTEGKALVLGLIPVSVVLLLCQIALGWIFKWLGMDNHEILMCFLKSFIMYGMIEEFTKYAFAHMVIKKFEKLKKIDIMLIFGFVGMGYEIMESIFVGDLFAMIARGVFVAHIMYQFVMGHFFYESIHAKNEGNDAGAKKNGIYALAIPILIHGFNDLFCELTPIFTDKLQGLNAEEITTAQAMPSLICVVAIILTNLFCLIWGLMLAKKDPGVETSLIG